MTRLLRLASFAATITAFAPVTALAQPSYYKDVLPILQEKCQTCHRATGQYNMGGLTAPMAFSTYEDTRPWARAIARKVQAREMPPWFADEPRGVFDNERLLTEQQIATLVSWADTGATRGNDKDAPPARSFATSNSEGWTNGTPDFIVSVDKPFVVEDQVYDLGPTLVGTVSETILPRDTWVRGWEFQTGTEGSIVHHMCVQKLDPGVAVERDNTSKEAVSAAGGLLSCMAEGAGANSGMLPDGYGLLLKKGSKLTFNMHYHKQPGQGTGKVSQPRVGFYVSKNPPRYTVKSDSIGNVGFLLPPNKADYRVGAGRVLEQDTMVLSLWPHAHLRAKAARYVATYPDGRQELLLNVPRYDQGWQETYTYRQPKLLPRGTRIDVSFWYDNTPERGAKQGFDPTRFVWQGPRTDDEMALGFITYAQVEPVSKSQQEH